ncbi:OmpP1/FadL family transporter [Psychrilyobacter atlanticus]|uniref:OmpP1/FadL family transporter n=1 Tax=Psychrilyobacter atlanticus TaxID=271091 RepID=UPI0004265BE4|nr:outer membrane protein transport protein [Psychrilyobacter atlanticus]
MKKILFGCIALLSTASYGASVDALANSTPAYMGNPAQNATLTTEAAYYNPAGLVHLEDGNYISVGGQLSNITYEMEKGGENYKANDPLGLIPNLSYIHKSGDWAFYGNTGGAAGGPTLDYEDGVPLLDNLLGTGTGTVEGKNAYAMANLGAAYRLNNEWSVAAGVKYIYAQRNIEIETSKDANLTPLPIPKYAVDGTYDAERTAQGFGGTFGINYRPNDRLNMAMTYNTKVKLEFEADSKGTGNLGAMLPTIASNPAGAALAPIIDGDKRWRDLPAELKYGVAYKMTDKWTVMGGGNYYFVSEADTDGKDGFKNGWEVNVGTEYQVSERWTLTTGYNYAETGATDETFNDTEFALDSHIFTAGAKFQQTPNLEWTFSTMYVDYIDHEVDGVNYKKNIIATGISAAYKF